MLDHFKGAAVADHVMFEARFRDSKGAYSAVGADLLKAVICRREVARAPLCFLLDR